MKKFRHINHRIVSLFMAVLMLLTSMSVVAPVVSAAAAQKLDIVDNALHFIIRHWHTADDTDATSQGNQKSDYGDNDYFVLVEGYIVPDKETGSGYRF